jgi:hypothetical protein
MLLKDARGDVKRDAQGQPRTQPLPRPDDDA